MGLGKVITSVLVVGAVAGGAYYYSQSQGPSAQVSYNEKEDFQAAKELLQQDKPKEAVEIINRWESSIAKSGEQQLDWLSLFIDANTQLQDFGKLVTLYRHFPQSFADNEEGSTLVATAFLAAKMTSDYDALRSMWEGRETDQVTWFGLDADRLIVDGNRTEALKFLQSRTFEGPDDASRLSRLALLHVQTDPKSAWNFLSQAFEKAPENPEVRSLRGRLLEGFGKADLAQLEYTAAARIAPDRPFFRDQLAEFHVRRGQYTQAVQLWAYGLQPPSTDYIWMKALFWQSVTRPFSKGAFEEHPIPDGEFKPLVEHLLSTSGDQYWNEAAFQKMEDGGKYLQNAQATFWLRVLQSLKDGKEQEALSLIEFNHFAPISWHPRLEKALHSILLYRLTGQFELNDQDIAGEGGLSPAGQGELSKDAFVHQFFTRLDEVIAAKQKDPSYVVPDDFQALLLSDEAFTAALFAAGWLEAGLQLHKLAVIPKELPDWLPYAITQALRYNRGPMKALEFATKQPGSPNMDFVIGHLMLSTGSLDSGIERLKAVSEQPGPLGLRAAHDIALTQASQKQWKAARSTVKENDQLRDHLLGKELLARISLMEGKTEEAYQIYVTIADESAEAQSFLAKRAYDEQDWGRAKDLTIRLLRKYPNSAPLRANLSKILEQLNEAEAGSHAVE